ncbi:hypothetical protein ACKKBG_A08620 [Auxenochlorella protothecoides x Auxenochlorella symbiontica]
MASYIRSIYNSLPDVIATTRDADDYIPVSKEDAECFSMWGVSLADEGILIQQLRDELELSVNIPPQHNTLTLRRFLRARKHDVAAARAMFLSTLKWREEYGADRVLQDFVFNEKPEFAKFYPEGCYGVDRAGHPVYVQQPGNIDLEQLFKFTTEERCVRYHVQQQERYINLIAPACSVAAGRCVDQSLVLIDLQGVGVSTLTSDFRAIVQKVLSIDQAHYPELMWKSIIINAPTSFRVMWGMVKYMLDTRTQVKVQVLSSNWREELQEYIAPDQLPKEYGGTNPAPLSDPPGPWRDPAIVEKVAALTVDGSFCFRA